MNKLMGTVAAIALIGVTSAQDQAFAQEKLKIGVLTTLSGPAAVLGTQQRNGFELAVKKMGGKLGGRDVEIVVQDDELKPDVAVSKAKAMVERDKVDFVIGPIFSNVLLAMVKPITEANVFLISANAGPSTLAGKECNPFVFVNSYQNDQMPEVMTKYANDSGIKKAYLIAPNYQAGKDSLAGFKRDFKGQIVDEVYVPLNTLDFSAELSRLAAAAPEAIYVFLPGGMGVNFVKQFRQAGLADKIKFLSSFTVDESTLPAQKEAAVGMFAAGNWAPTTDNPQNKAFVADYEAAHNAVPGSYAMQGYDAALMIDSALEATKGVTTDKDALRAALRKADFKSLRGNFKFNTNQYPIQDFYLVKIAERKDGKFQTEIQNKVLTEFGDVYAKDCKMK